MADAQILGQVLIERVKRATVKLKAVWQDNIGRIALTGGTTIVLSILTSILQEFTPTPDLMWMITRAVMLVVAVILIIPAVKRIKRGLDQ